MKNKLFVIRKYIYATSALEAIKKDKKTPCDDIWVDEEFKKTEHFSKSIKGFTNATNSK